MRKPLFEGTGDCIMDRTTKRWLDTPRSSNKGIFPRLAGRRWMGTRLFSTGTAVFRCLPPLGQTSCLKWPMEVTRPFSAGMQGGHLASRWCILVSSENFPAKLCWNSRSWESTRTVSSRGQLSPLTSSITGSMVVLVICWGLMCTRHKLRLLVFQSRIRVSREQ